MLKMTKQKILIKVKLKLIYEERPRKTKNKIMKRRSGFNIFQMEKFNELQKSIGNISLDKVNKYIGSEWNNMSVEYKNRYKDLAKQNKEICISI